MPDVEVKNIVAADRFMLLGCDGIWELKSGTETCEFINQRINQ